MLPKKWGCFSTHGTQADENPALIEKCSKLMIFSILHSFILVWENFTLNFPCQNDLQKIK